MSEPHISLIGFILIFMAAGYLQLVATGRAPWPRRIETFGRTLRAAQVTGGGRVAVLLAWWWFGWHFIAR